MSEGGEKQFDPTPSRIAKARREGNLPRSQEFGANIAFVAAAVCIAAIAPTFAATAQRAIEHTARGLNDSADLCEMLVCAVIVAASGAGAAIAAGIVQSGGLSVVTPTLQFSRIAPADGLKRMFSREAVTHALRAILAVALASCAIGVSMRAIFSIFGSASSLTATAAAAWSGAQHVAFVAAATGVFFALVEYGVARRSWLTKLKMSLHELKRELKENDGDPMARARRKALHRNVLRGAISKVKDASLVIVNPTHVAVALEYRPPEVPVPMVMVRAADEMALRVREVAVQAGVPVIEHIPLARALFAQSEVGQTIPHEHYVAVAEIVAAMIRSGALS